MRYWILSCLLLLGLTMGQALAGVVEDAEEELKKLKQQQSESGQATVQAMPELSYPEAKQVAPSGAESSQGSRSTAAGQEPTSSQSTASKIRPSKTEINKGKRVRKREASDRLLSLVGIVIFLLLIVAGALYGKRSDNEA